MIQILALQLSVDNTCLGIWDVRRSLMHIRMEHLRVVGFIQDIEHLLRIVDLSWSWYLTSFKSLALVLLRLGVSFCTLSSFIVDSIWYPRLDPFRWSSCLRLADLSFNIFMQISEISFDFLWLIHFSWFLKMLLDLHFLFLHFHEPSDSFFLESRLQSLFKSRLFLYEVVIIQRLDSFNWYFLGRQGQWIILRNRLSGISEFQLLWLKRRHFLSP